MDPDEFEADLLKGLAQLLASEGVGTWTESGSYTSTQTGIVIDAAPETLNRMIQLSLYPVDDDESQNTDVVGLQVIARWEGGNPLPSRQLDTQVFNRLQGRNGFTLSTGVQVAYCKRVSGVSLGIDASKRWARSSNYYLTVYRPSSYRL